MKHAPADWKKAAVTITPGFEANGDPYVAVSGDFDGMGISCGALQWNIGQGSLQPMVKAVGKALVLKTMPVYGDELWTACNSSISKGLAIVRGWQSGSKLKAKAKAELSALMDTPQMRVEQDKKIDKVAEVAFTGAKAWASSQGKSDPSKRLFCWFFDLTTQNGGLEGLTYGDIKKFIVLNKPDKADDVVCDFLAAVKGVSGHAKDARKNATLWRNQAPGEKLEVLVMSYLRSKTAKAKWRHVVINRKGTVALGVGWVNSTKFNLSAHGL